MRTTRDSTKNWNIYVFVSFVVVYLYDISVISIIQTRYMSFRIVNHCEILHILIASDAHTIALYTWFTLLYAAAYTILTHILQCHNGTGHFTGDWFSVLGDGPAYVKPHPPRGPNGTKPIHKNRILHRLACVLVNPDVVQSQLIWVNQFWYTIATACYELLQHVMTHGGRKKFCTGSMTKLYPT